MKRKNLIYLREVDANSRVGSRKISLNTGPSSIGYLTDYINQLWPIAYLYSFRGCIFNACDLLMGTLYLEHIFAILDTCSVV